MLLYNKRDSEIDIYHMNPKKKKLKEYRKKLLLDAKDPIMYRLRTNNKAAIDRMLGQKEVDIYYVNCKGKTWSSIEALDWKGLSLQKDILIKYVNGKYSTLEPTRVLDNFDCTVYRFLRPNDVEIEQKSSEYKPTWQIDNMINLPKKLYLLQLLQLGDFEELVSKDIEKQLQLFDINYWRSVKIDDVSDMIETGLVSGTAQEMMKKVKASSKILKKVKK